MKNISLLFFTVSTLLFAKNDFRLIHVNDLWSAMSAPNAKIAILDANTEKTRKTDGVIRGAKLLSSFNKFDVTKELPSDKSTKLVFYCANTQCMASHAAAERARDNGYSDVNVMADGIQGWKKAGKPTDKI